MTLRKKRLTVRKNSHSKSHLARAQARRESRVKADKGKLEDDVFCGFDVQPLRPLLRVLSLFDGIGTTLYVLDKLNLHIEAYYSCEIDPHALEIQKYRFGDRIIMLGDVLTLTDEKLHSIGPISLLIGGSPCSDLSLVNPRRRGLLGKYTVVICKYNLPE